MIAPRNAAEIPTERGKGNITVFTVSHPNDLTLQKALKHTLECRILGANFLTVLRTDSLFLAKFSQIISVGFLASFFLTFVAVSSSWRDRLTAVAT